jgi:hypothetical protein
MLRPEAQIELMSFGFWVGTGLELMRLLNKHGSGKIFDGKIHELRGEVCSTVC